MNTCNSSKLMTNILHLDASGRHEGSVSRRLSTQIVDRIKGDAAVTYRDIGKGLAFVDDMMIGGYFTREEKRSDEQRRALILSDQITKELFDHDVYVIGMPIYNFAMPAAFKAWCDLAARVGITFKYTDTGPVGLLAGKKVYMAIASGVVKLGSEIDFITAWLKYYLGFLGITDITIIAAEALSKNSEETIAKAEAEIKALKAL